MIYLLLAVLGLLFSPGRVWAATNIVTQTTNSPDALASTNASVDEEYRSLMEQDDAAHEEVDKWITDNRAFAAKGAGEPNAELNRRIRERLQTVRNAYESFIERHPNHAKARVAYASFLGDLGDEDGAETQLEKALELDKTDPAIYNNLANIYGHHGPVTNAFDFYQKAIDLNPLEPVYYQNFGTTVFLFRKDAREYFNINEQQVFDKAMALYDKALKLDPTNFALATDVAETYYGIKPDRTEDALRSWTNALNVAHGDVEREGVYVHLARVKLHAGRFAEAHAHLNAVTNEVYADLKNRLTRNLKEAEGKAQQTNKPPDAPEHAGSAATNNRPTKTDEAAKAQGGK